MLLSLRNLWRLGGIGLGVIVVSCSSSPTGDQSQVLGAAGAAPVGDSLAPALTAAPAGNAAAGGVASSATNQPAQADPVASPTVAPTPELGEAEPPVAQPQGVTPAEPGAPPVNEPAEPEPAASPPVPLEPPAAEPAVQEPQVQQPVTPEPTAAPEPNANPCADGQLQCEGACRDVSFDNQHCGECNNACEAGQACSGGECSCPDGESPCDGGCVNTQTNSNHCGQCSTVCASGLCAGGSCEAAAAQDELIGWATVDGNTTGGAGGDVVEVSSAGDFASNVGGTAARTVRLTSDITGQFEIGSNKTVIGANANITINGGLRIDNASNIILKNLRINGRTSPEDGLNIDSSHHVWVDHCEFFDAPDGNLDIKNASDYITISWTHFHYTDAAPASDHRYSNLIGSGDGDTQDRGHLRITWHHNWWGERVHERMPRVRFGQVHVFNNYYSASGNNYCIRAGFEANILVENNYFDVVSDPHEIDGAGATMVATGNEYNATSGAQDESGSAFEPPYDYQGGMDSASSIPNVVQNGAGPQ